MLLLVAFLIISNRFRPGNDRDVENHSFLVPGQKIAFFFMPGVARASQISTRLKIVDYYWCGGVIQSAALFTHVIPPNRAHRATFNGFSGKRCFVTKWNVNKLNNISNRSSVLPILCKHRQFSAIVERTQSDHSDCRHWMEGVSTTKPGTESFFFNI